jgi:hypothetical protein
MRFFLPAGVRCGAHRGERAAVTAARQAEKKQRNKSGETDVIGGAPRIPLRLWRLIAIT